MMLDMVLLRHGWYYTDLSWIRGWPEQFFWILCSQHHQHHRRHLHSTSTLLSHRNPPVILRAGGSRPTTSHWSCSRGRFHLLLCCMLGGTPSSFPDDRSWWTTLGYGSNDALLVEDSVGRGWCAGGRHANGLRRHFGGSLRMGLNTWGLSLAGSSNFFQSSIQRKAPATGAQPHARLLSTHVNVVNLAWPTAHTASRLKVG